MSTHTPTHKRARKAVNRLQVIVLGALSIAASFFIGVQTAGEMDTVAQTSAYGVTLSGDINGDGRVDVRDAIVILEMLRDDAEPTVEQLLADPDEDGVLTIDDALHILRAIDLRS